MTPFLGFLLAAVFVTNERGGTVSVIDTTTDTVVATATVGNRLYLSAEDAGNASILDVASGIRPATLVVGTEPEGVTVSRRETRRITRRLKLTSTDGPVGMALSPDEKRLYVATGRGNSVLVIDTATLRVIRTIPGGDGPWGITVANR